MDHQLFAEKLREVTLLYVEDDPDVRAHISEFLRRYTSGVLTASSAEEALELYRQRRPDILLLDINLPGINGIALATMIRREDRRTRIVISTAYTDKAFLLTAVELHLTRYLVKPITSEELVDALLKAVEELRERDRVDLGKGCYYDRDAKRVVCNGVAVPLRRKEMQLLEFFIRHPDRVLSYEVLQYEVWQDDPMSKDALRAQIRNIRKKTHPGIIRNHSAVGYRLYDGESM